MLHKIVRTLALSLSILSLAPTAHAAAEACRGRDLMAALPAADLAAMQARVADVPFAKGLFWQAQKGDARIILIGTYHFADQRHQRTLARFSPDIAKAAVLLVEAGPAEEAALAKALRGDPTLMADPDGPPLSQRLGPADWSRLSAAMTARGVPPSTTDHLRPWYLATMLGLSPCMLRQTATNKGETDGLDHQLIALARKAGTPVRAIEPWDTLFSVFAGMAPEEELDMLRAALPQAEMADDYATTLTEAYFSGNVWQLWEFGRTDAYANSGLTRAEVDKMTELSRRQLMDRRNHAWLVPLTAAAEKAAHQGKAVVAGFGALHLPGEAGLLNLLQADGWTITPLKTTAS
ncbi:TraB/GumN family protein [Paracoccus suum]|uniref:TraB/GumN family protein n=1 Tax=Paracoccus suum TaxID=2259340 RepID=A0A344PNI0_9RHOB|nr:TraB/GumN family protein [Paracoccus suum]AXC50935.1 TraB/GumN family protein [Paracoccus suum]